MNNKNLPIKLAAFVLFTLACVCSSSTPSAPPEKVGEATPLPQSSSVEIYKVGDIIQAGNITVTLNSATFNGNILDTNFTVENNGSQETTVSSLLSFEAKDDTGLKLEVDIFDCSSSIDGTIVPGDKTRGSICWTGFTAVPVRIYFTPELFSSQTIVWEVSR